jgi:hypothetical protein
VRALRSASKSRALSKKVVGAQRERAIAVLAKAVVREDHRDAFVAPAQPLHRLQHAEARPQAQLEVQDQDVPLFLRDQPDRLALGVRSERDLDVRNFSQHLGKARPDAFRIVDERYPQPCHEPSSPPRSADSGKR